MSDTRMRRVKVQLGDEHGLVLPPRADVGQLVVD
jgi:hypothetical protein